MASTHFSVIALLALTCPFASGDRDRQQNVVEVADRGHFRQSQQETNTDTAASGVYSSMEGQTGAYDPNGAEHEKSHESMKGYAPEGGKAASASGTSEKELDAVEVQNDIATFQQQVEKENVDEWPKQDIEVAKTQDMANENFQKAFKDLHTKLKTKAMASLKGYEASHGAGSYQNFAGEVMSLKPDRATELVAVANDVEDSNYEANKASNAYTKHLEALSSNLAGIHDLMGSEASYGYNQIKAEIDSGKAPFKSVTIVYPLRAVENGQTFNYNSTDFTDETRKYFDGPVLNDLKDQLSRYKDDYHFTFCLHASSNLGSQRYWGNGGKHEYAKNLVESRKAKLQDEVNKLLDTGDLKTYSGSTHVQAQWTEDSDRNNSHAEDTSHFGSAVPFGVIMVLGDPKKGFLKDADKSNADHAQDVDAKRGCASTAKDMDELVTSKYPAGKVSYTYINGLDKLPEAPKAAELTPEDKKFVEEVVPDNDANPLTHSQKLLGKLKDMSAAFKDFFGR